MCRHPGRRRTRWPGRCSRPHARIGSRQACEAMLARSGWPTLGSCTGRRRGCDRRPLGQESRNDYGGDLVQEPGVGDGVPHARRSDHHGKQETDGVGDDAPLPPDDLLLRRNTADWDDRIAAGLVAICDLTELEVLHSARSAASRTRVKAALDAHYAWCPVDLSVAAAAEEAGLTLLHYDRDFETIARTTGQPVTTPARRWVSKPFATDRPSHGQTSARSDARPREPTTPVR